MRNDRRTLRCLLPALAGVFMFTACVDLSGLTQRRPSNGSLEPQMGTRRVKLMSKPGYVRDDYAYPADTLQSFAWGGSGAEWRVRPADLRYAYAGFMFRNAYDFSGVRPATVLSFRLRPVQLDQYISVGLIDGDKTPPQVMVDRPVAEYRLWERRGWGIYAIRLDQFANGGIPLEAMAGAEPQAPVDWTDIAGIRLITASGRSWDEPVLVRDLQFGPMPWTMRAGQARAPHRDLPALHLPLRVAAALTVQQ